MKPEQLSKTIAVDEEETEPDTELQAALARARRLRQAELAEQAHFKVPKVRSSHYCTTDVHSVTGDGPSSDGIITRSVISIDPVGVVKAD